MYHQKYISDKIKFLARTYRVAPPGLYIGGIAPFSLYPVFVNYSAPFRGPSRLELVVSRGWPISQLYKDSWVDGLRKPVGTAQMGRVTIRPGYISEHVSEIFFF